MLTSKLNFIKVLWVLYYIIIAHNLNAQKIDFFYKITSKEDRLDTSFHCLATGFGSSLSFQYFVSSKKHILNDLQERYGLDKAFTNELQFTLVTDASQEVYRVYLDSLVEATRQRIDLQTTEELAVYAFSAHTSFGDMFILKPDKNKSVYYWKKYKAYPFLGNYWFQLSSIDSTTWGNAYKVYYYCVSCGSENNYACKEKKTPTQDYLEIGYCPKLGAIYSYNYIYSGVKITLKSIDNQTIEEFIKAGKCVKPFCEIE